MFILVYIMLYCWPIISLYFFSKYPIRKAILFSLIGGILFLPSYSIDLPLLPDLQKDVSISLALILGELYKGKKASQKFKYHMADYMVLIWCTAVPVITSLYNGLGLKDGLQSAFELYLHWGVIFWFGRRYFVDKESFELLVEGIFWGGIVYIPLCLFEIRMSPQLSNIVYDFFPHSFLQHVRYGGYRPIVFMLHGLMVALWMAAGCTISFWYWMTKKKTHIFKVPMSIVTAVYIIVVFMCKSMNGIIYMIMGIGAYFYLKMTKKMKAFRLLVLVIPIYILIRIFNIISVVQVQEFATILFDPERIHSLVYRLEAEDLYGERALERPLFGWGAWGRNRPIDPNTGKKTRIAIDSIYLIFFSRFGFFGLFSSYLFMLTGIWIVLKLHDKYRRMWKILKEKEPIEPLLICLIVLMFMIDTLLNGMVNQVYIFSAGALISYSETLKSSFKKGRLIKR